MPGGLVGRRAEIGELLARLGDALEGEQQLVLCTGEAGIGKTRLARELAGRARSRDVPVVWGRAADTGGEPAFWPWRQVVRGVAAVADLPGIVTDLGVAADLAMITPEVPAPPAAVVGPDPDEPETARRFRAFDALSRVLTCVAAERGLVVVLDDMHQADPSSLRLLVHLARDPGPRRLLFVVAWRDVRQPAVPVLAELVREPTTSRMVLVGLCDDGVGLMLESLGVDPRGAARMRELTGGNPFFVGELGRAGEPGRIPDTVRSAVRTRVAGLSRPCRELLAAASVLGGEFPVDVLAAVLGWSVGACLDVLDEAVAVRIIEDAPGEAVRRFGHALLRDVVAADLSSEARVRLHRAAASTIERGHVELSGPPATAALAAHWAAAAEGGAPADRVAAARWAERAGREAGHALAYEEAARLYRTALDVGAADLDPEWRFGLELALAVEQERGGELGPAREACRRAAGLARSLDRPDLLARAALVMEPSTTASWDRELHTLCADALHVLPPDDLVIRTRLLARMAEARLNLDGDRLPSAGGEELSRQALAAAEASGDPGATVAALRARHLACAHPGGVADREELARRLAALGRRHHDPRVQAQAHAWRTDAALARGDLASAAAVIEEMAWCSGEAGAPLLRWRLLRYRGVLAQARGELTAARRLCDAAFATVTPLHHPAAFPLRMQLLGAIDRHGGTGPDAVDVQQVLVAEPGGPEVPGHGFRIMDYLGPALLLAEAGLTAAAEAKFRAAGPVEGWRLPPYFRVPLYAMAILTAVRIGRPAAEVAAVRDRLVAHRGLHVVPATEVTSYLGPVELYLGKAAAYLGELDVAATDLSSAAAICSDSGAAGFVVEARCELADVLIRRGTPADLVRAGAVVAQARAGAARLGMAPWSTRLEQLATATGPAPLTPRETEVADLVAKGLTNRTIAAELHISDRTAANHVQHILGRLGLANRSQIAVWVARNRTVDE